MKRRNPQSERSLGFGNKLKSFRASRGWTQVELAFKSKLATGTIAGLELGVNLPRGVTASLLANAFGITEEVLLEGV